jgi:hypothetical protein
LIVEPSQEAFGGVCGGCGHGVVPGEFD